MAPDNQVSNRPYRVFIASGEWTCSISRLTGTMTGPLVLADGTEVPPTGKAFSVDFCTVAHWVDGRIVDLLATKLEAFAGWSGGDLLGGRDFADIYPGLLWFGGAPGSAHQGQGVAFSSTSRPPQAVLVCAGRNAGFCS